MQLKKRSLALACGMLWGGAFLLVGSVNLGWPLYGEGFLQLLASVYPGYTGASSVSQLVIGTLYALVDGLLGGWLLAWLYNQLTPATG